MARLDSLGIGDEFLWRGVRFRLRDTKPTDLEGKPRLPVMYMMTSGLGTYRPGDRGLMCPDDEVELVKKGA